MGDLTKNISRSELYCKCGDPKCNARILEEEPIIDVMQSACDFFEEEYGQRIRLYISSPARCYVYNRSTGIGSNDDSQHPRGNASDFKLFLWGDSQTQIPPVKIHDYLCRRYHGEYGFGVYDNFNHGDTRPGKPARWDGRRTVAA